jgi:transcriptional regulator with XRE-family HTH domain
MGYGASSKENAVNTAREVREQLGLSRPQLAALLGVSPATVRHIETGERKATEPVRRLLLLLGSEKLGAGVRYALEEMAATCPVRGKPV